MTLSKNDITCKTIIVGDSGVGKTSLMYRFCRGDFITHNLTVAPNCEIKCIKILDKTVKIEIWDTAGQEKFLAITKLYFRNAMGVVFVYDVTRPETLINLEKWFKDIAEQETSPDVIKVLVGHKCEDESSKLISTEEGKAVADHFKMKFFEASSKDDVQIYPIFHSIASDLCAKIQLEMKDHEQRDVVVLNKNGSDQNKSKSSCC